MKSEIRKIFEKYKIEYYTALDYRSLRQTRPDIIEREGFVPRSVIIYLVPYYAGKCENISVYAASLDYHILLGLIGNEISEALRGEFNGASVKAFGDHSPIDERHAAVVGGLGIFGKNGLLINERYGSYVFIGEVITDIAPDALGVSEPRQAASCIACGACLSSCPTGALSGCGECLSAITQRKGELEPAQAELLLKFNTVWGCDVCQTACPYNARAEKTPIDFFYQDRITSLTSEVLSSISKDELTKRAFGWRGRKTLERNLRIYEKRKNSK